MRFGCCAIPEQMDYLAQSGFDYAELVVVSHLKPEAPEEEFLPVKEKCLSSGIKAEAFNGFLPGDLKVVGPSVDRDRLLRYVKTAFRRAKELGGEVIVFGSGAARMIPENFFKDEAYKQMKEALALMAPVAGDNGITVCVEPLLKKACNFLNRVDEAERITREVNLPEIKVLADIYHMAYEDEPFSNLVSVAGNLAHIHVCLPDLEWIEALDVKMDHKRFFHALKQIGYGARVTIEDNGSRVRDWKHDIPLILQYLKSL